MAMDAGFFLGRTSRAGRLRTKKEAQLHQLCFKRGASRNRTGDEGFADPRLTAWLRRHYLDGLIIISNKTGKGKGFF